MNIKHSVITTDVLVIGSGCTGLGAALEIAKEGLEVVVVEKGEKSGQCGASIMAIQLACAALGVWEEDSPELHAQDTIKWGRGLSDPKIVARMTERAPARILEFEKWGMKFATKDGKLQQLNSPGHTRKRALYVDFKYGTGRSMMQALSNQLKPFTNLKIIKNTYIRELLKSGDQVAGAIGFDVANGEIVVFHAKTVVLATGGGMEVYGRNSGSRHLTGDGYRLAFLAGAPLLDMEFVQFIPMGTLYPNFPGLVMTILEPMSYRTGGRLTNAQGEEFLDRYIDGGLKATRDIISYAMAKEVLEGRGTPHGGLYFEPGYSVGAEGLAEEYGQQFLDQFKSVGINIASAKVEVFPIAHYFMGGIRIDADGRTPVGGLLAAGEVAAGIHGANRLAGNSLTDVMVFGQVIGESAVEDARKRSFLPIEISDAINKFQAEIINRLNLPIDPEINFSKLRENLQNEMLRNVGPVRTGAGLQETLDRIIGLEQLLQSIGFRDNTLVFNQELIDLFEFESMISTAKLIVQAAIYRKESRGAHHREDFSIELPEWTRNIILKYKPGQPQAQIDLSS